MKRATSIVLPADLAAEIETARADLAAQTGRKVSRAAIMIRLLRIGLDRPPERLAARLKGGMVKPPMTPALARAVAEQRRADDAAAALEARRGETWRRFEGHRRRTRLTLTGFLQRATRAGMAATSPQLQDWWASGAIDGSRDGEAFLAAIEAMIDER